MNDATENTDREIWRETPGDAYSPSIHVTEGGGIGINCGGYVYVKPLRDWHKLAETTRVHPASTHGPLMHCRSCGTVSDTGRCDCTKFDDTTSKRDAVYFSSDDLKAFSSPQPQVTEEEQRHINGCTEYLKGINDAIITLRNRDQTQQEAKLLQVFQIAATAVEDLLAIITRLTGSAK